MKMNNSLLCLLIGMAASSQVLAVETANTADKTEISGVIELEYGVSRGDSGNATGPLATKAELEATFKPTDKVDVHGLLLYEDKVLSIDQADVTWHALPDDKLEVIAGKQYLPFGAFESAMISGPMTKDLGEASQDKVLQATSKLGNIQTKGYVFDGTSPKTGGTGTNSTGYGLSAGYATETASVGVDYLSNLVESKYFETNDVASTVPAVALHGSTKAGRVTLIGEYVAATTALQAGDLDGAITVAAKPAAIQLEADVDLNNDRTVALAWNGSSNAEEIGLAKDTLGVTYSQPLFKGFNGALELMQTKGYDGAQDKALTAQLAYEF
jgi:hypothetical protein